MPVGLIGIKAGMTRVFDETGRSVPVTVIKVSPNRVAQLKTEALDGYTAVQLAVGACSVSRLTQPQIGHLKKAGIEAAPYLREYRVSPEELAGFELGQTLSVTQFEAGDYVDVTAVTKGKGFQGGVKRHNFKMQDATHGNSISHRAIGSTGQCQTPGRVLKGKKMPGQMGAVQQTIQNQRLFRVDSDHDLLLIAGAVPGAPGGYVMISNSVKRKRGEA